MRFFNTTGPCEPERHYMVPPLARLPEAPRLIDEGGYFVVHAPRQTGKTTTLRALATSITAEGKYTALYLSCKAAEPSGDNLRASQLAILHEIESRAEATLPFELRPRLPWPDAPDLKILSGGLRSWAQASPRPVLLLLDEIDTLHGQTLRSVLAQLHAGFPERPKYAPWSVILCGMRDVRDYREAAGNDPGRFGSASPFNIKVKSLRLGDFSLEEVRALYAQHHAETGQSFSEGSIQRIWELSEGQPWLVNALAREIVVEMGVTDLELSSAHVELAKERLILARQTHLDSLLARLSEDRVRRVVEPVIAGAQHISMRLDDDVEYVQDLGLFAVNRPIRIANPIYREVIVRALAHGVQRDLTLDPRAYVGPDGRIDMDRLIERFMAFYRESGEILEGDIAYHEVAPQLVMMAFLQGVVNGRGMVAREYGLGRDRIDLLMRWPYEVAGKQHWQEEAIELKVWRDKRKDPLEIGLEQLDAYLDRLGIQHGYLVVFDRRTESGPLVDRIRCEPATTEKGRPVTVLRA